MNYLGVLTLPDFVESFPKITEAAYPLKTVKLLHHHSQKLNSKKCFLLTNNPGIWQHCLNAPITSK